MKGFYMVYRELHEKLTTDAAVLFSYIRDVEQIIRDRDGDYFRLSNSFIQELFWDWGNDKIKAKLDELVKEGYIDVQQKFKVERKSGCRTRWVKILHNPEVNTASNTDVNTELNTETNTDSNTVKYGINNNNITTINTINNNNNGEASSPTEIKSSPNNISGEKATVNNSPDPTSKGRKSLKDQLVEYINEQSFSQELKNTLFDWLFQIGLPRKVSVKQLHSMLVNIWNECSNDEKMVIQAVKNAYLNNWFGFYKPKADIAKPQNKPQVTQRKADPSKIRKDMIF